MNCNPNLTAQILKGEILMHDVVKIGNVIVSNPKISTGAKALCFYFLLNPNSNWLEAAKGLGINKETFFRYVKELSGYGYLRIEYYDQKGAVKKSRYVVTLPDAQKSVTDNPEPSGNDLRIVNSSYDISNSNDSINSYESKFLSAGNINSFPSENIPCSSNKVSNSKDHSTTPDNSNKQSPGTFKKVLETVKNLASSGSKNKPEKLEDSPGSESRKNFDTAELEDALTWDLFTGIEDDRELLGRVKQKLSELLGLPASLVGKLFKQCRNDYTLVLKVLYQIYNARVKVKNLRAYLGKVLHPASWDGFLKNVETGYISGSTPDSAALAWFVGHLGAICRRMFEKRCCFHRSEAYAC